jgi:hypothetical protein
MSPSPDQPGTGIAGVDFDPFTGQQNVDDFYPNPLLSLLALIQWIAGLCGWKISITGYAPFHNYYQWHVFEEAVTAGWSATAVGGLGAIWFPAIPSCPILWQSVSHYWAFGGAIGILLYDLMAFIRLHLAASLLVAALTILVSLGQLTWAQMFQIILQHVFSITTL